MEISLKHVAAWIAVFVFAIGVIAGVAHASGISNPPSAGAFQGTLGITNGGTNYATAPTTNSLLWFDGTGITNPGSIGTSTVANALLVGSNSLPTDLLQNDRLRVENTTNDFSDAGVENLSSGACATAEFDALNNASTLTTNYGIFGITGGNFTGIGCANTPYTGFGANEPYLISASGNMNFSVPAGKALQFFANGQTAANLTGSISSSTWQVGSGTQAWCFTASSTDLVALDITNCTSGLVALHLGTAGFSAFGTSTAVSKLVVAGNLSVGADSNVAAPTNGLTVEGGILSQASSTIGGGTTTSGLTINGSATTTLLDTFSGGFIASASTTIGSGKGSGLTINGSATTTGTNLVVQGTGGGGDGLSSAGIIIQRTDANSPSGHIFWVPNGGIGGGGNYWAITSDGSFASASSLAFGYGAYQQGAAQQALIILSNLRVGIGTTTPTGETTIQVASSTSAFTSGFDVWGLMNTVDWLFQRIDEWGHLITSGPPPVLSGCGTSTISGNDQNGTITLIGTALTSCTMTFAHAYAAAPDPTVSDNTTASVADISSVSASAITYGLSVGLNSGALYYNIRQHQ